MLGSIHPAALTGSDSTAPVNEAVSMSVQGLVEVLKLLHEIRVGLVLAWIYVWDFGVIAIPDD